MGTPAKHDKHHDNYHHGDDIGDIEGVQVHTNKEISEKKTEDCDRDTERCHHFEVVN